jgi:hypothetical protein
MNNNDDRPPTFQEEQAHLRFNAMLPFAAILLAWVVIPFAIIVVISLVARSFKALMP